MGSPSGLRKVGEREGQHWVGVMVEAKAGTVAVVRPRLKPVVISWDCDLS